METKSFHSAGNQYRVARKPIDHGYQLVVRTVLWVISGAVIIAFAIWWFST